MATYLLYKPYLMLSQFTKEAAHHITLKDLNYNFEKDVYPIGRLDHDSEGLLLLSNDKLLNKKILHPSEKQTKTYWAQVEGIPQKEKLQQLATGVDINVKGKIYHTQKATLDIVTNTDIIPDRNPPIRYRKNVPDTWVSITIIEGKNRQVRKMFAAIGHPVLRLIRAAIAGYSIEYGVAKGLKPGELLKITPPK